MIKTTLLPPKPSDIQLARAYGGGAKPRQVKRYVPYTNKGGTSSEALNKSASGSVRGYLFP